MAILTIVGSMPMWGYNGVFVNFVNPGYINHADELGDYPRSIPVLNCYPRKGELGVYY